MHSLGLQKDFFRKKLGFVSMTDLIRNILVFYRAFLGKLRFLTYYNPLENADLIQAHSLS